jgi:hypothetical protein
MPKPRTDIERATRALEREYERAGRNVDILSQKTGIHPTLLDYWVQLINQGEKPVNTDKAAGEILAAIHGQSDFFTGPGDLHPYDEKITKDGEYHVKYFPMQPGHDLPGESYRKAEAFQIRIKDKNGGWHSTNLSIDMGTVMGEADALCGEYDDLEADEFIVVEYDYLGEE